MLKSTNFISFDDKLKANNGHGPGFDVIRLLLSVLILIYHSFGVSYGPGFATTSTFGLFFQLASLQFLPMFFALSGFLVAGSYFRTKSLFTFLSFRVLRIVPALATEIFISAVIIGGLVTTLPASQYYTNPLFFRYFANIVGYVHFYLPGVFTDNPNAGMVNRSLWTIPAELACYGAIAVLIAIGLLNKRRTYFLAFISLTILILIGYEISGSNWTGRTVYPPLLLLVCFLSGVLIFLYKDVITADWRLAVLAAIVAFIFSFYGVTMIFAPLFVAYVTAFLGIQDGPLTKFRTKGDYSYGVYLYAYPIQQLISGYFPATREWYWNASISLCLASLIAFCSWHVIEKPTLSLKRYVPNLQRAFGRKPPEGAKNATA